MTLSNESGIHPFVLYLFEFKLSTWLDNVRLPKNKSIDDRPLHVREQGRAEEQCHSAEGDAGRGRRGKLDRAAGRREAEADWNNHEYIIPSLRPLLLPHPVS